MPQAKNTTPVSTGWSVAFWLAVMVMAGFLGALLAPAMPAVLAGAMSVLVWKIFVAVSVALAVPGFIWLRDTIFYPTISAESMEQGAWDVFYHWGRALAASLLLMPLMVVLMPGAILAFGVSVAPHLLGAGVGASSAHLVSMAFLQGIVVSAGILFGLIAAVQTVGAGIVKWSRMIDEDDWEVWRIILLVFGLGAVSTAPVVILSVVGVAYAAAGQGMLHAGRLAYAGFVGAKAAFQGALAQLPPLELVFGAIASISLTPATMFCEFTFLGLGEMVGQWKNPAPIDLKAGSPAAIETSHRAKPARVSDARGDGQRPPSDTGVKATPV